MLAIIACGTGLAYITIGAGRVVYGERTDFEHIANVTICWVGFAGFAFVVGLLLLLFTVALSVVGNR